MLVEQNPNVVLIDAKSCALCFWWSRATSWRRFPKEPSASSPGCGSCICRTTTCPTREWTMKLSGETEMGTVYLCVCLPPLGQSCIYWTKDTVENKVIQSWVMLYISLLRCRCCHSRAKVWVSGCRIVLYKRQNTEHQTAPQTQSHQVLSPFWAQPPRTTLKATLCSSKTVKSEVT